jgi:hypothetical protein
MHRPAKKSGEAVFVKEGEYWTLAFSGEVRRVRDRKGLAYLATLLARPGERVEAVDLDHIPPNKNGHGPDVTRIGSDRPGNDSSAESERARINVTRAIHSATRVIASVHPFLGVHLERTIRTGRRCSYLPDPLATIRWKL